MDTLRLLTKKKSKRGSVYYSEGFKHAFDTGMKNGNDCDDATSIIKLEKGYVVVPRDAIVVDISDGIWVDVGVISDRKGELAPVVVIAGHSLCGLTAEQEDRIVDRAIENLPIYKRVKRKEIPFPSNAANKKKWDRWLKSFRLGLFPLAMFRFLNNSEYRIYYS